MHEGEVAVAVRARQVRKTWGALLVVGVPALLIYLAAGGWILVVDHPEQADVIVVLAGEYHVRPERGVELLRQGLAPRLMIDVPRRADFGVTYSELASAFIASLPPGEVTRASLCSTSETSTQLEAQQVRPCLQALGVSRVLLVTSDYHSRRALATFRHELPEYRFSAAAGYDARRFGQRWWQHREWAKHFAEETVKFAWFEVVGRWWQ
jgi:DUF218 domain-containing protein